MTVVLDAAREAHAVGLCVLPVADDGSKRPAVPTWKQFQSALPTATEFASFGFAQRAGLGVISGAASGYRECWDFDCLDAYGQFIEAAAACGLDEVVRRISTGFENATPGGGRRWIVEYPREVVWKDVTLARRVGRDGEPAVKTLIEMPTFAIVAPSHGQTHPSGRPYVQLTGGFSTIATYSTEERRELIALARTCDQIPRPAATVRPLTTSALGTRPGDDYARRTSWGEILKPEGWTAVYDRAETSYWRRPGKVYGVSASTNLGGSDLLYVFSSSTPFDSDQSFTKFGAFALLHHKNDFGAAARDLSRQGYGVQKEEKEAAAAVVPLVPPMPHTLAQMLAVFRRWLSLDDPSSLIVIAAALAANRATGDPVWVLLVSAPSTGKTEILSATTRLPWVLSAAKVTEASLLSGTSKRERTSAATGGVLRQIGAFGVLVCKDFTSVLAQNKDSRAEAMAALREVYDGAWDRPVGTDGGRVLSWKGKCGFIGGVTPAIDQYGQVVSALGDRFVLLRMGEANVEDMGAAALRHGEQEHQMRQELGEALAGAVEAADMTRVNRALTEAETNRLIRLAAYTSRSRTAVMRDGYGHDVVYQPQVEGPGRLVKAFARLLGGCEALGCDAHTAWGMVTRLAVDCAPAFRTTVIRALVAHPGAMRTSEIAHAADIATKTASRYLEDLLLLKMAVRTKQGVSAADNSPDYWEATDWLREHWPGGDSGGESVCPEE